MTPRQHALLRFIRNQMVHLGKAPTYREMKAFLKVGSNQAIDDLLTGLEKEHYIKRGGKIRGIQIAKKGFGYNENFDLSTAKRLASSPVSIFIGNVSVSENQQRPSFEITGVDSPSSFSIESSFDGNERGGNTNS